MKIASILIAHNVASWVGQALDSVIRQSRPADQLIVVENGSTDGTLAVLEDAIRSNDSGAAITLASGPALGAGGARNHGAEIALGSGAEVLAFLDGDDWWDPGYLRHVSRALMSNQQRRAAFGTTVVRSESGRPRRLKVRWRRDYDYKALCRSRSPMVTGSALLVRAAEFDRVGGFDSRIRSGEDWELLLRLTREAGTVGRSLRGLVNYRKRPGAITRDAQASLAGQQFVERLHPGARRAKHWWWLLNQALVSGDAELIWEVRDRFPRIHPGDLLSPQFLKHVLVLLRHSRSR